jgi:hypothetical protein
MHLAIYSSKVRYLDETLKFAARCATSLAAMVAMAALVADSARAADELDMRSELSPFSLRLGVYDMNLSTVVRVDGQGGNFGTRLNFEKDLNLADNKDTFNAALRWRFKERHFVELEYFRLDRSGFRRLDGEIRFGDSVFPVGANIRSSFTTEVTRLGYSYRVVRNKDWGLAVGAGLHVTRLRAALTQVAFDNSNVPIGEAEIAKVTAPLPVIGLGGARRLGKKWALLARAQFFAADIDDIDGTIKHGAIYFEHDTFDNFGFGVGYDWFVIDIKAEEEFWVGRTQVRFDGPMLFLKGSF